MANPNIPTVGLERALSKGLACCNSTLPTIEYLEKLAVANPAIEQAVQELRIKHAALEQICRTGLLMDQNGQTE